MTTAMSYQKGGYNGFQADGVRELTLRKTGVTIDYGILSPSFSTPKLGVNMLIIHKAANRSERMSSRSPNYRCSQNNERSFDPMDVLTTLTELVRDTDTGVKRESGSERDRLAAAVDAESEMDRALLMWGTRKKALLKLIELYGGRVHQAELVDRTGWSKSSVSRYLSELETDGAITRVRIGRGKIVLFPDDPRVDDLSKSNITD
ncbi:helix-turn-helix transcriptional regulator [Halorussus aquaticus]|uniref:Helix-turn-helix transcriptional regulator n=1 Tax=Halorussus aquaticus TaxID=2953748 RepID=A0ABD5Q7D5_9EURY|nr:helix-turn-helix domain-containing protein [Halorussus aquaticus]